MIEKQTVERFRAVCDDCKKSGSVWQNTEWAAVREAIEHHQFVGEAYCHMPTEGPTPALRCSKCNAKKKDEESFKSKHEKATRELREAHFVIGDLKALLEESCSELRKHGRSKKHKTKKAFLTRIEDALK